MLEHPTSYGGGKRGARRATVAEYEEDELADGSDDEKDFIKQNWRREGMQRQVYKAKRKNPFPKKDWGWKLRWQSQSSNS